MNELTVRVELGKDQAKTCMSSLQPELESDFHGRSKVELSYNGELVLHVCASDLHAMRAAANTYLRWLNMCLELTDTN